MYCCTECMGCAIHVLLDKVMIDLEQRNIDEYWCLLTTALEIVDDLVAQARKLKEDQSSCKNEKVEENMPVDGLMQ